MGSPTMESPQKTTTTDDPANPLVGFYPKERKAGGEKELLSRVHCGSIQDARMWEPPKCLSTDEDNVGHIHTMEY